MPMTRFRQKIERSWNPSTTRSIRNVVRTVVAPMTSGSTAARAPRKKKIDSRISSGKASISARPRSSEICAPSWSLANSCPPSVTSLRPSKRCSSAARTASSSALALQRDRQVGGRCRRARRTAGRGWWPPRPRRRRPGSRRPDGPAPATSARAASERAEPPGRTSRIALVGRALLGGRVQALDRLGGVRVAVGEAAAGVQQAGHGPAHGGREDGEQRRDHQDAAGAGGDAVGE